MKSQDILTELVESHPLSKAAALYLKSRILHPSVYKIVCVLRNRQQRGNRQTCRWHVARKIWPLLVAANRSGFLNFWLDTCRYSHPLIPSNPQPFPSILSFFHSLWNLMLVRCTQVRDVHTADLSATTFLLPPFRFQGSVMPSLPDKQSYLTDGRRLLALRQHTLNRLGGN